jgi:hypothetical protein
MSEFWLTVVVSSGASTLLVSALDFVFRTWISERLKRSIQHEYDLKLEAFKAEWRSQHETALERMRADLNIAVNEHYIRFSKLHERRAEVVADCYAKLDKYASAVDNYLKDVLAEGDLPLA